MIIPGGWHKPHHYIKLRRQLTSHGFCVSTPVLPSLNGSRPPDANLSTDTAQIRSSLERHLEEGSEVIVLMHSYGGQIGTNALHGLDIQSRKQVGLNGGVRDLIYMSACALPEGKAMIDMVRHFGHEELMPYAFDFADDMSCVNRDPRTLLIGADSGLPESEVDDYVESLVRWNGQCMYDPLTTERAAWRDVPVAYIHTTKDVTVPFEYQKWLVDEMRKGGVHVQTKTLEAGHCASFTATEGVLDVVRRVAAGEKLEDEGTAGETKSKEDVKDAILNVGDNS